MQRRESKGFIELVWVCPNCDTTNRGSVKACESCGAPQPENVKFERASNANLIVGKKAAAIAKEGADIHCGFCGTRNPSSATNCSQCGADLKEGKARQAGELMQAAPPPVKSIKCVNCGTENPGDARKCEQCGAPLPKAARSPEKQMTSAAQVGAAPSPQAKPKKTNWFLIGGILSFLLICCVGAALVFFLPAKSLEGTVTDVYWQTSVPVQEVQAVNYSNEKGSPPSDAYNVSCRTESQEVCEEKTIDRGNGYAEVVNECHTETEQYCSYTLDEWKTIQTYDMSGHDLYPVYAEPTIYSGQRTGSPSETYTVYFSTDEGQKTYSPGSAGEFQQFQPGTTWTIKLNALGSVVDVK